jgi:hypothetical protein
MKSPNLLGRVFDSEAKDKQRRRRQTVYVSTDISLLNRNPSICPRMHLSELLRCLYSDLRQVHPMRGSVMGKTFAISTFLAIQNRVFICRLIPE